MQQENWEKVKEVLEKVLMLDEAQRRKFLNSSELDNDVRREVESLLAVENEAESLMDLPAIEFSKYFFEDEESSDDLIDQNIGAYKIVRELGYGGMGAVYLAERADGKFRQKVALKLLKREMNTQEFRRRFEQERNILASLEHPNIARLLDAGTTNDNIPFLAMEYVEGLPITEYCQTHNLDLTGRLDLFQSVCSGVNFAHRNLVVHRDLKPSNIFVTIDGVPKLLDFGISKILSADFNNINEATITKLGAMTPAYASPEQLQSKSVTTATDIYSLGVILYELLTSRRPFQEKESDLKEIYSAVIEKEPPLPSAIIESPKFIKERTQTPAEARNGNLFAVEESIDKFQHDTAANRARHTIPGTESINAQNLRGDLDNIILKALRKEPERRYSSAENFAEDVKRYLRGLPVTARSNTFTYRAEKFIKRNLATVTAGCLIVLAIIIGIIATLWQAQVAQAERIKAEKRFTEVRKLANSYIFDVYPEVENLEGSLKAREKILLNALQYLDSLANETGDDFKLQSELATAYEKIGDVQGALNNSSLGNTQAGLDSYNKARKLRESVYSANQSDTETKEKLANNYYVTARTLWNNSQTKDAEEMFERGLKLRRELAVSNPDSVEFQNRLAVMLIDYGAIPVFNAQMEQALLLFNEALTIVEKLRQKEPGNSDFKKTLTRLLRVMSKAKSSIGDFEGGIQDLTLAVAISKELAQQFPSDFRVQRSVWLTNSIFCELYISKLDGSKAVETCVPTIEFPRNALQKEPENGVVAYDLAISHFNSARALRLVENYPQSIEHGEKAIEVMVKLSNKMPDNADYKRNLAQYETEIARVQIKLKNQAIAIKKLQTAIQIMTEIANNDDVSSNLFDLAMAYRLSAAANFAVNNKSQAIELINKAIALIQRLKDLNDLRDEDKNMPEEMQKEKEQYSS